MPEWSSGYNVDLGYTYGFYREISPAWLDYAAAVQGVASPSGQWRYLELGCGHGVGLVLLAALHPDHDFLGIDFNPLHIAHGRFLAVAAGLTNVQFEEADFVDLAKEWPTGWGKFNYVTAHGIYSWLAEPVRKGVVQTIEQATAPGALVYLSYNAMPGCAAMAPVQHLLRLWQTREALPSTKAVGIGVERLKGLIDAKSGMTSVFPAMGAGLDGMKDRDPSYLVHEYLHDNWQPLWFDEVAREVAAAKLVHVGTATLGEVSLPASLSAPQKAELARYEDPVLRQVMMDVLVNQGFRRDVFARGAVPLWPGSRADVLKAFRFGIANRPGNDEIKFNIGGKELPGKKDVYVPLLDALEAGPKTMTDLLEGGKTSSLSFASIVQAMTLMLHAEMIRLHTPLVEAKPARTLNAVLSQNAAEGGPHRYLAATKTGAVLQATDIEMTMLSEMIADPSITDAKVLASKLVVRLVALGKSLVHEGKPLREATAMMPYAQDLATRFLEKTYPLWKEQGVV